MSQTLSIIEVISSSQYVGRDSSGKTYRLDSTVVVRKGQTVRAKNGRITGVIRAETPTIYEV